MARKALWDADTIRAELEGGYNDLQSIPARHLKRLVRLLHLYEHAERWTLKEKLNAKEDLRYVHGYVDGVVMAVSGLRSAMQSVLDGTFEEIREEDSEHGPEQHYVERDWDERFGE